MLRDTGEGPLHKPPRSCWPILQRDYAAHPPREADGSPNEVVLHKSAAMRSATLCPSAKEFAALGKGHGAWSSGMDVCYIPSEAMLSQDIVIALVLELETIPRNRHAK